MTNSQKSRGKGALPELFSDGCSKTRRMDRRSITEGNMNSWKKKSKWPIHEIQMTDSVQGASKATPTAAAAAGRDGKPVFLPRSCTNRLAPADIHPTTTRIWPIVFLQTRWMYFSPAHFNISHCCSKTGLKKLYKTSCSSLYSSSSVGS